MRAETPCECCGIDVPGVGLSVEVLTAPLPPLSEVFAGRAEPPRGRRVLTCGAERCRQWALDLDASMRRSPA